MAFLDKAGGGGYRIHRHDTNTLLITTTIQQTVMNIEVSIMSINLLKLVCRGSCLHVHSVQGLHSDL